jgi:hypothetical protein
MKEVYLLYHAYGDRRSEVYKLIGAFDSIEAAQNALDGVKGELGFRDHPTGFSINRYVVDELCWTEGFIEAEDTDTMMDRGHSVLSLPFN